MGQIGPVPGDEHIESVDIEPINLVGVAAYCEEQRLASKRSDEFDERIKAEVAALTAKRDAGQLTKEDLELLLDRGDNYDAVRRWSRLDDANFYGILINVSNVKRTAEDSEASSENAHGGEANEDYNDTEGQSIDYQRTPSGSSHSEQSSTVIYTPPGSIKSETSTIRHLPPDSLRSALDDTSLHDPNPWFTDYMHVGVTQESVNARPFWPCPLRPQTQTRTTQHEDVTQALCDSADNRNANPEQKHENAQSPLPSQKRTSISDREGWRISPRMARMDQAREATAKDVLAIRSARHFERDFKLALYFNKGALADVVTVLWLDIGRVFHKHHENHEKGNDHKQRKCVPEAAISVAVTFAKTSLGPYMVNHVIPQSDLAFWTEDAIQCAWTSVYRRAWDTDVANAAGQFVDDVLEKFMRLGEELDLD